MWDCVTPVRRCGWGKGTLQLWGRTNLTDRALDDNSSQRIVDGAQPVEAVTGCAPSITR
jgi:hypothetical protein